MIPSNSTAALDSDLVQPLSLPLKLPLLLSYEDLRKELLFWKDGNNQKFLTDRIHRRYGMWDPCDLEESVRKTKDLESDVKA